VKSFPLNSNAVTLGRRPIHPGITPERPHDVSVRSLSGTRPSHESPSPLGIVHVVAEVVVVVVIIAVGAAVVDAVRASSRLTRLGIPPVNRAFANKRYCRLGA
jgi:hypothetical protein